MASAPEHIFKATEITALAEKWKRLNASGRHQEAMVVLEEIVILSSAMFECLAQHEEYHRTVDLPILVAAAQEKVVKWLLHWSPAKGKIFSFFSKCAKNAFRSELQKVNQYRTRFHTTGESLEKYYGVEEHDSDKADIAAEFHAELRQLTCRWGCPQEHGAIKFLIECVLDQDNHDRQKAINTVCYAWAITPDLAKFFYWWVLVALRNLHLKRIRVPYTREDILRLTGSYTTFAELLEILPLDKIMRIMATMGGTRIAVPTMNFLARSVEDQKISEEISDSDQTPDDVAAVAKKYKRSPRNAQQAFEAMTETLNPLRSGEHYLYGEPPQYADDR